MWCFFVLYCHIVFVINLFLVSTVEKSYSCSMNKRKCCEWFAALTQLAVTPRAHQLCSLCSALLWGVSNKTFPQFFFKIGAANSTRYDTHSTNTNGHAAHVEPLLALQKQKQVKHYKPQATCSTSLIQTATLPISDRTDRKQISAEER
jgi:hypothetical protein